MKFTESQQAHMAKLIEQYKRSEEKASRKMQEGRHPHSLSRLKEIQQSHKDMANGGGGGMAGSGLPGEGTIRGMYYSGYPNEFFQELCSQMEWNWRQQE